MNTSELERKALRLETLVETKIVREHGLIPMFVRLSPMHVWRAREDTATDRETEMPGNLRISLGNLRIHRRARMCED